MSSDSAISKKMEHKSMCSILVSSCDAYEDLWVPFFTQFFRHWPDCPFPAYLGTEAKIYNNNRVTTLLSNGEQIWSNCLLKYLEQIKTPYILLLLEDFFLRKDVKTVEVINALDFLVDKKGKMMRIGRNKPWPSRGIDGPLNENTDFAIIRPGFPARVTLQASFWEKQALVDLLLAGENIWEFEVKGSERSWKWGNGFFCTIKSILPYKYHVIEKGKWLRHEALKFSYLDIGCDFTKRPLMSRKEMMKWWTWHIKGQLTNLLPACIQPKTEIVISQLITKAKNIAMKLNRIIN